MSWTKFYWCCSRICIKLSEESLFYLMPFGAMETCRKLIEFQLVEVENSGGKFHEEADTLYDATKGETSNYYFPGGFACGKPLKLAEKERKKLTKSCAGRLYDLGTDSPLSQHLLMGRRSANGLSVGSTPTKHMWTASRLKDLYLSTSTSGVFTSQQDRCFQGRY